MIREVRHIERRIGIASSWLLLCAPPCVWRVCLSLVLSVSLRLRLCLALSHITRVERDLIRCDNRDDCILRPSLVNLETGQRDMCIEKVLLFEWAFLAFLVCCSSPVPSSSRVSLYCSLIQYASFFSCFFSSIATLCRLSFLHIPVDRTLCRLSFLHMPVDRIFFQCTSSRLLSSRRSNTPCISQAKP